MRMPKHLQRDNLRKPKREEIWLTPNSLPLRLPRLPLRKRAKEEKQKLKSNLSLHLSLLLYLLKKLSRLNLNLSNRSNSSRTRPRNQLLQPKKLMSLLSLTFQWWTWELEKLLKYGKIPIQISFTTRRLILEMVKSDVSLQVFKN
jgi:hypothetical protein